MFCATLLVAHFTELRLVRRDRFDHAARSAFFDDDGSVVGNFRTD
jgi:hypothetical protein